ncbi:hypothetical protein BV22DRAFT_1096794 [Leucogyrophana mollusca]|uniref:Uncharacterized protein n=1 Tax=Leucogyrophana mollusca TaxID=85980 RepID=A0ACB8B8Y8_9AGAM|nr:hypothetical protein BV22DRAFT_1096794 [Leucogyrophana mollusca]
MGSNARFPDILNKVTVCAPSQSLPPVSSPADAESTIRAFGDGQRDDSFSPRCASPSSISSASSLSSSSVESGDNVGEIDPYLDVDADRGELKRDKTPQVSDGDGAGGPAGQRYTHFWLEDGNTVIRIKNVLYRLHRSRLRNQSVLFRRVLDTEQRTEQAGAVDYKGLIKAVNENGVLVYHLLKTTVSDFEALLAMDMNPSAFYFQTPSFFTIASILRVATDLEFIGYGDFTIQYFEERWSHHLSDVSEERIPHALEMAVLGRRYDVPRVLKRAFYEVLRTGGFALANVTQAESESTTLDTDDIYRLFAARENLTLAWVSATACVDPSFVCPEHEAGSSGPGDCPTTAAKCATWNEQVHAAGLFDRYMYDPICGLEALMDIDWEAEGWCEECIQMRVDAWTRMRTRLWTTLEMWLELPPQK